MSEGTAVWKYELRAAYELRAVHEQLIAMPRGAVLVCVDVQSRHLGPPDWRMGRPGTEQPCLWAVVHPERETCVRRVLIVGTGQPTEEGAEYVGTFQLGGGRLVFHVFDAGEVT